MRNVPHNRPLEVGEPDDDVRHTRRRVLAFSLVGLLFFVIVLAIFEHAAVDHAAITVRHLVGRVRGITVGSFTRPEIFSLTIMGLSAGFLSGILGMGGGVLLMTFLINDPIRSKRLMAFLEPLAHRSATAYQLFNGKLAVATGGLFGSGLGTSRQKLGFIPEAHTDFVLSIIGEELGVIGISLVAFAFTFVLVRGLRIALHSRCEFGRLLAMGIVVLIGAQTAINFGVVLGLLPTKGLTLPFISYGGSSLLVMSLAVGILLNVGRGGREDFKWPKPKLLELLPRRRANARVAAQAAEEGGVT